MTTSIYPVPSICSQDQISDWFASLAECLHWNVRKKQKHFDELSDLTRSSSDDTMDSLEKPAAGSSAAVAELSDAKSAATQKSWKQNKSQFQFFLKRRKKLRFWMHAKNFTKLWLRKTSLWARIWWIFDDFWLSWYVYDHDNSFSSAFRMIEQSIFYSKHEWNIYPSPLSTSTSTPLILERIFSRICSDIFLMFHSLFSFCISFMTCYMNNDKT